MLRYSPEGEDSLQRPSNAAIVTAGWCRVMCSSLIRRLFLSLGLLLVTAGCSSQGPEAAHRQGSTIADPFADFLDSHPALAVIGDPLTPPRTREGLVRQTFIASELVFDPGAPEEQAVMLAPLGLSLGLAEPPVPPPQDAAARYVSRTGHTVYTGFLEIFGRVGGEEIVGAPISEARFESGLILQYFENLGFYREESEPPSETRLLAFGSAALGEEAPELDEDDLLPPDLFPRPFAEFLDRLGGEAFFGRPLGEPRPTSDGSLEQVYERAVLWAPLTDLDRARLRPLGLALGAAEPPVAPASERGGYFVSTTGHNIHRVFAPFYFAIDGEDILGAPLDEAHGDGPLLRQRFENGILEYNLALPPHLAIQLAPLGVDYLPEELAQSEAPATATVQPAAAQSDGPVARTWVQHSMLARGAEQRIYIEVLRSDGAPWSGVVPLVRVAAPQGPIYPSMPPTDVQGRCSAVVDLGSLPPGEIITYEVVVTGEYGTAYAIGQFASRLGGE
jgi:hypothetical protein